MADYIDGTKEDTIFLLIEILVVESSGLRSWLTIAFSSFMYEFLRLGSFSRREILDASIPFWINLFRSNFMM
jgi:hypothetical protein